jgi:hypothetical protein
MMDEFSGRRILKHIETIDKTLISMDKTLALQEQSLREHIKRTNILEQKLEPVEKHVEQVRGVTKFLTWLAAIGGAVAAFLMLK